MAGWVAVLAYRQGHVHLKGSKHMQMKSFGLEIL